MQRIAYVEEEGGPRIMCFVPADLAIHENDQCIVETNNLLEFGRVTRIDDAVGRDSGHKPAARILRRATLQDQAKQSENALMSKMAVDTCVSRAAKCDLALQLVSVRYSFDRSLLMVLFTSEDRVDFREMVKELTEELGCRIEMRQVGVRDKAGMVGGLGPCGRVLCCCSWLDAFDSVNVRMAKAQRLSLNPGAISGMCGRLKCCLRYEYECYRSLGRNMPRDGAKVVCPSGKGCVIDKDILAQKVTVRVEDDRVLTFHVKDVDVVWKGGGRVHEEEQSDSPETVNSGEEL